MMRVVVREGTVADGLSLIPRLRIADIRECVLLAGENVEAAVSFTIENSQEVWVGELNGQVIAIGGCAFRGERPGFITGTPWLIASDEVMQHKKQLIVEGRKAVSRWREKCDLLYNFVHADNAAHIEWLRRIGFRMGRTYPEWGAGKAPFTFFFMPNPSCVSIQQPQLS